MARSALRDDLYAAHAELTRDGLAELGLTGLNPRKLRKMDDVDNVADLMTVGSALGRRVNLDHLGWAVA